MSLAPARVVHASVTVADDDAAFIQRALTAAQRALAKRASPTVVKPESCLARVKREGNAKVLAVVAPVLPLVTLALPKSQSISGAEFLHRVNHVVLAPCSDGTLRAVPLTRDEIILAIAAFCGYDKCAEFGLQEYMARWRAHREVRGAVAPGADRSHRITVAGYVAGLPNETARVVQDYIARLRVQAEDMVSCERAAEKCLADGGAEAIAQAAQHRQMAVECQGEIARLNAKLDEILTAAGLV